MRIETHEIDTQARKIVPIALPRQWEFREMTGRDYGVDMELEIFKDNKATGQILLFQIKGTKKDIIIQDGKINFDVPTKTLIYSERFITPLILAFCPINSKDQVFYYLWLQEYIKSVLNFQNPNWRNNKSTTRVKIPEDNSMPGNEDHLSNISHFPQRLYGACEVARILDNLRYTLNGEPLPENYGKTAVELTKILYIPGYLNGQWNRGELIRKKYLEPAILSAQLLADQREPTDEEIKLMPIYSSGKKATEKVEWLSEEDALKFNLKGQLTHGLECISFFFEETNYGLNNILWETESLHNF